MLIFHCHKFKIMFAFVILKVNQLSLNRKRTIISEPLHCTSFFKLLSKFVLIEFLFPVCCWFCLRFCFVFCLCFVQSCEGGALNCSVANEWFQRKAPGAFSGTWVRPNTPYAVCAPYAPYTYTLFTLFCCRGRLCDSWVPLDGLVSLNPNHA